MGQWANCKDLSFNPQDAHKVECGSTHLQSSSSWERWATETEPSPKARRPVNLAYVEASNGRDHVSNMITPVELEFQVIVSCLCVLGTKQEQVLSTSLLQPLRLYFIIESMPICYFHRVGPTVLMLYDVLFALQIPNKHLCL